MKIIAKTDYFDDPNLPEDAHWLCEIVTSDGTMLACEVGETESKAFNEAMLSLEVHIVFNSGLKEIKLRPVQG